MPAEAHSLGIRAAPVGEPVAVGENVLAVRCGLGRHRAARAARTLVESGARALLSWGSAAALASELGEGDLVLASDVITGDGRRMGVDTRWHGKLLALAESAGPCYSGSVAEADAVLVHSDDKLRLHALTGATIADMESAAVAEVAGTAGVPMLVVRAVSDTATMRVPAAALAAVDDDGEVHVARCLARLAREPAELVPLLRLARGFRAARVRLTRLFELAGPGFLGPTLLDAGRRQA